MCSTMIVALDANVFLFQETYMARKFQGGKELAQVLLAWLAAQFPDISSFSLYLIGDFDRLFGVMDHSGVDIPVSKLMEFVQGFIEGARLGKVELTKSESPNKTTLFTQHLSKQAENPEEQRILLGALSEDLELIFGENERQEGKVGRISLLEIVERLDGKGLDDFRWVSNPRLFRDRLYCVGM